MTWDSIVGRRTFLKTATAATGTVLGASTVSAATITVSDGESIQTAVDNAPSGSTIQVEEGTYKETISLPPSKALTLVGDPGDSSPGAGPDTPALDGELRAESQGFLLDGSGDQTVEIRGFKVKDYGTIPDDKWGKGVAVGDRSNLTVEDCTFENIAGSGVRVDSDGSFRPANWTIRRNRFVSIDHSAVHLNSNDAAVVANNVVESGPFEVNDSPDRWWEDDTEDHNPKAGIEVHATGRNGNDATLSDIDIVGNRITGTYDDTAIRVLSINKNPEDDYPDSETLATDITISGNDVDITDELDDDGEGDEFFETTGEDESQTEGSDNMEDERDESGIIIGANPEAGPAAFVDGVEVAENTVRRANAGVGLVAQSPAEISNVEIRDNVLTDGIRGISLNGHGQDVINGVDIKANEATGNATGVALLSGDPPGEEGSEDQASPYVDVMITENQLLENDRFGVIAVGDRKLDGAIIHRNDIQDNRIGGALNDAVDTLSASCNFWDHATGPKAPDNKKGQGDRIVGDVRYEPWLPQSFTRVPEKACKLENHRNE